MKADTYEVHGTCLTTNRQLLLMVELEECGRFTFLTDVFDPDGRYGPDDEDLPCGASLVAFSPGWPNNPLFTGEWYPMVEASS